MRARGGPAAALLLGAHAQRARVTVITVYTLCVCVCVCVCLSIDAYSRTTGNEAADEGFQRLYTRRRMHGIFGERERANWGRVSTPTCIYS